MIVPEGWRRGSTPTNIFNVNIDLTGATIYVTYSQGGRVIIEKTGNQLEVTSHTVSVLLSQEDTLKLDDDQMVEIQIRYVRENGMADASNIIVASAGRILKDGKIQYV